MDSAERACLNLSSVLPCGRPGNKKHLSSALADVPSAKEGRRFDHSFSHRVVWSTWKQHVQRVSESERIGADRAIKYEK